MELARRVLFQYKNKNSVIRDKDVPSLPPTHRWIFNVLLLWPWKLSQGHQNLSSSLIRPNYISTKICQEPNHLFTSYWANKCHADANGILSKNNMRHSPLVGDIINSYASIFYFLFLAHLSRRLKVRYCDHSPSVVVVRLSVRPSVRSQSLNNISSWTSEWILTKLHRNDPWLVLFQSCSNGSGPLHI